MHRLDQPLRLHVQLGHAHHAPLRIVLRKDPDTEGGYVVHTEALKLDTDKGCFVHSSYYGGSYCYYGKDGMLKAVEKFTERAAEL